MDSRAHTGSVGGTRGAVSALPAPYDAGGSRRRDIQGLRAIAVLPVVAFHAGLPLSGGFAGVDVFFVISGFVITLVLQREWSATGRVSLSRFFVRRFLRLAPALAAVVLVTVLVTSVLSLGMATTTAQTGLGALLLSANLVIATTTGGYFEAPAESNPLLNLWSLSVEEQFYLVFPLLLVLGWVIARRGARTRRAPLVITSVVLAVSLAGAVLVSARVIVHPWLDLAFGFYGPAGRAWEFAVGAVIALILPVVARWGASVAAVAGGAGVTLIAVSAVALSEATPTPGLTTLVPVLGAALVLIAGSAAENPISRLLASRPLVAIGDVSYSWYLWHWPVIVIAGMLAPGSPLVLVIAAVVSIVPAIVSYRWLEQPLRAMHPVTPRRAVAVVGGVLVAPLLIVSLVLVAVGQGFWLPSVQQYRAQIIDRPGHLTQAVGCNIFAVPGTPEMQQCVWNSDAPGTPIYLLGDSFADHLSEGLALAAADLEAPLTMTTQRGCPWTGVDATFVSLGTWPLGPRCRAVIAEALDAVAASPAGVVVISFSDHYFTGDDFATSDGVGGYTTEPAARLASHEEWLRAAVRQLEVDGHAVVLVRPTPTFDRDAADGPYPWQPEGCSLVAVMAGDCRQSIPEATAADRQSGMLRVLETIASDASATTVLDLWPALCRDGQCATDGLTPFTFDDALHLSPAASAALSPQLAEALERAAQTPGMPITR
ncbi:MAG: hypothetical protein RLZZ608_709 [Actinomycetota bacterium]